MAGNLGVCSKGWIPFPKGKKKSNVWQRCKTLKQRGGKKEFGRIIQKTRQLGIKKVKKECREDGRRCTEGRGTRGVDEA